MTQQDALREAKRRWGETGWVLDTCIFFHVGYKRGRKSIEMGRNTSWEAAFEDADRKQAR